MSSLFHLTDDIWHEIARHLPLTSIFSLLQTNSHLHARLLSLLPSLTRAQCPTPVAQRDTITAAMRGGDVSLATFLLRAPGVPPMHADETHPLRVSFRDARLAAALTAPLTRCLIRDFLRAGGLPSAILAAADCCDSADVILSVAEFAARGPAADLAALALALVLRGRTDTVLMLLHRYPALAAACAVKKGCRLCMRQHSLLHAAAETGDFELIDVLVKLLGEDKQLLLDSRDCDGESALSIAIRKRRSRVAQQLVQSGAQVRDLVGCASRGGGRLGVGDVWFKPVVDVD